MYYLRVGLLAAVVGLLLVETSEGFCRRRFRRMTQSSVALTQEPKKKDQKTDLTILCPSDVHNNLPPVKSMYTCVSYDSEPWGIIIDPTNPCQVTPQLSSTLFSTSIYQIAFDSTALSGRGYILRVGNYDVSDYQTMDASFNVIQDSTNCDCANPNKFKRSGKSKPPTRRKAAEIEVRDNDWPKMIGKDMKVPGTIWEKGSNKTKKLATSIYGIAIVKTKKGGIVKTGTTTKQGPDFEITFDGLDPTEHYQLIIQVVNGTHMVRRPY